MTAREEWLALAARLEAATGPDLALDGIFAVHFGWTRVRQHGFPYADDEWIGTCPVRGGDNPVPAYTASIDAAAGAVEREFPGWLWGVTRLTDTCHAAMGKSEKIRGHAGQAVTPALALMAALCRAKAEEAGARKSALDELARLDADLI